MVLRLRQHNIGYTAGYTVYRLKVLTFSFSHRDTFSLSFSLV